MLKLKFFLILLLLAACVAEETVDFCESCIYANDGDCDDGRIGSKSSLCEFGSDCTDCENANLLPFGFSSCDVTNLVTDTNFPEFKGRLCIENFNDPDIDLRIDKMFIDYVFCVNDDNVTAANYTFWTEGTTRGSLDEIGITTKIYDASNNRFTGYKFQFFGAIKHRNMGDGPKTYRTGSGDCSASYSAFDTGALIFFDDVNKVYSNPRDFYRNGFYFNGIEIWLVNDKLY